ncbi:uncharacterized protein PGTG_17107 [Puccinia graminis f. sp. tritici CRL 75-36-700-3]|uniref:Uncharacterized protein n=1 Tax=Puccinia graminis f. sp. tritici (strain CRL 75-36-700-3 / race SCCL) TaxID=418459 RepID=E3L3X5_PUCGT|nr:uncharacterized protein PGTG_17107 [Puccinia graminis f. sp. tritici CRL 75-36-700-3]EFP91250.2 hypothetical protein PGTG_17107 [Puccinia graminis f. sp. tritici CRL 75-36-700-3]
MTPLKHLNNLDLDDMLPELPFSNVEGGSQKDYLRPPRPTMESLDNQQSCMEPSQRSHSAPRATRVFTENPTTESQLAAAGGNSTRLSSTSGSTIANNGNIRPIAIDYVLFNRTTTKQIAEVVPSRSKGAALTPNKEWERIVPHFDTVWKAALEVWSWPQAQQCIITLLGEGRENIDKHIRALEEAGLLKWQCILANHGTYGSGKLYYVYSDEDFAPFVAAMVLKPKSKVTIKILMTDPRRSAKDKESEKSENDSLAMSYAPDDERLALQKVQTRLALNPKCDMESAARTRYIVSITEKILATYGGNAESLRIKDPDDPMRSIRVTRNALFDWSRALVHDAKGVTEEIPPDTAAFVSEPMRIYTLAEQEANNHNQVRPSSRRSLGKGTPGQPKFTPAQVTSTGRVRPPRIASFGDLADVSPSVPVTPLAGDRQPNAGDDLGSCTDDMNTPASSWGGNAFMDLDNMDLPDGTETGLPIRSSSTDLEVLPGDGLHGVDRSPARKIPRSPAGPGPAYAISRLNFNMRANPRVISSTSPTRKIAGSNGSSSVTSGPPDLSSGSVHSSAPALSRGLDGEPLIPCHRDLPPLNDAGRSLGMEEFLTLCNFTANDMVPRGLIGLNHIRHWDFFYRDTDVVQLQRMGFPYPIAAQIMNGAEALGITHTMADDHSTPTPADSMPHDSVTPDADTQSSDAPAADASGIQASPEY